MSLSAVVQDILHGAIVPDPFRILEDREAPETHVWIHDQQHRSDRYFQDCPNFSKLEDRAQGYLDVVEIDQPVRIGQRYFYRQRDQGQQQASLRMRDSASGTERMLVDPDAEGPFTSVGIYRLSADGTYLAYEVRYGGEDRVEIRILDVNTGMSLKDRIARGFARGFAFGCGGYFYAQETEDEGDRHTIRFCTFGNAEHETVVFDVPRSPGSRLLLKADGVHLGALWLRPEGEQILANFWIASLAAAPTWSRVVKDRNTSFSPFLYGGRIFAVVAGETNGTRVVELSLSGLELCEVVPERPSQIRQMATCRDGFSLGYVRESGDVIEAWSFEGRALPLAPLPAEGSVWILPNFVHGPSSLFYRFESFVLPPTIYEFDIDTASWIRWFQRGSDRRTPAVAVKHVQVSARDGVTIPMTVVGQLGRATGKPAPMIMTAYGGFGASMTPRFSILVTILLELGATFALPHIRGGGEFGVEWHNAARGKHRQVAFDDFVAAAEWLIDQGLTTPQSLSIFGGSNGGLLVGAVMTQRPDLFRTVLCIAPLLDMVRYERLDNAARWRREYGTVDDPDDFRALLAYSPYHHVSENVGYPASMFVCGDSDDRCNPAHVRKMVARLQSRPAQVAPVIVDYSAERGHTPKLPLETRVAALTRRIAFLCRELGIDVAEGGTDELPGS